MCLIHLVTSVYPLEVVSFSTISNTNVSNGNPLILEDFRQTRITRPANVVKHQHTCVISSIVITLIAPTAKMYITKQLPAMSNYTPFLIIDCHVTQAQRSLLRWAVIMRVNQGTPDEAHYLIAAFGDEEKALAYAQTCFFYTGVSHIVQPLNP